LILEAADLHVEYSRSLRIASANSGMLLFFCVRDQSCIEIAKACRSVNAAFDHARFMDACETLPNA
jgi:hypothetical protein